MNEKIKDANIGLQAMLQISTYRKHTRRRGIVCYEYAT
jgi:hypothetical protein